MSDTIYSEADIFRHALATGGFGPPWSNGRPVLNDEGNVINCVMWLQVLAIPASFEA